MYPAKYAKADIAPSSTDASLITAKPGVKMRVIGGFLVCAATATSIVFNTKPTGSGTAISSTVFNGSNGGMVLSSPAVSAIGEAPFGYFETNAGEGLTATTGAGASVGVTVTYVEVR